jgi:hypothetical protein
MKENPGKHWRTQGAHPPKRNVKKQRFCRHDDMKVLRNLPFSRNQPLKSADDYYIGILKNIIKTYEYVNILFFFS